MKNRLAVTLAAAILLAPRSLTLAQGSGSSGPAFHVTRTTKGKLLDIEAEQSITVEAGGERQSFKIDGKTKVKADKDTELGKKKNLRLSDLKAGYQLKVTYRASDETAVEVRVINEKS